MLYQKLLMNERPYFVSVSEMKKFETHRHPDMEFNFCLKGSYNIKINNTTVHMTEGDFAMIGPMVSHEVPENRDCAALIIIVGTTLLSEYFDHFCNSDFTNVFFHLCSDENKVLYDLLNETADLYENPTDFSELILRGNVYKISAYVLETFVNKDTLPQISKQLRTVANIEKALELIYYHYKEDLSVEYIADLCGYSKTNFCKIFKKITGFTFHNFLNQHRIQVVCDLLNETDRSIEEIAAETGFANAKSLCKVFKQQMNCSPGQYRKRMPSSPRSLSVHNFS